MRVYDRLYAVIEEKVSEDIWRTNCKFILELFLTLQTEMILHFKDKLNQYHDRAFLQYFDKFWNAMKLYTKWNLTIFILVEKYSWMFEKRTLIQATLHLLKKELRVYNEKLSTILLKELQNDRDGNECSPELIAGVFRAYFEVDYEENSKIEMVGVRHIFVFSPYLGSKESRNETNPVVQKTTTFGELIKDKLFLETKGFYSKRVQEWSTLTVPDFLDIANSYLKKEEERNDL